MIYVTNNENCQQRTDQFVNGNKKEMTKNKTLIKKMMQEDANNSQRKRHSGNVQHDMAVNPNTDAHVVV